VQPMASLEPRNFQDYLAGLEAVLAKSHGGWADEESLLEFRRLCSSALLVAADSARHAQIGLLVRYAQDLYSDRAHHRWDIGPVFGADILRRKIRMTLSACRAQLHRSRLASRAPSASVSSFAHMMEGCTRR